MAIPVCVNATLDVYADCSPAAASDDWSSAESQHAVITTTLSTDPSPVITSLALKGNTNHLVSSSTWKICPGEGVALCVTIPVAGLTETQLAALSCRAGNAFVTFRNICRGLCTTVALGLDPDSVKVDITTSFLSLVFRGHSCQKICMYQTCLNISYDMIMAKMSPQ